MCEAPCLPGRTLRFKMEERQTLFSLSWRFCFGLSLPFCWLVEKVSKNPVMFYQFIHILCAQRAKCTFPPAQGNARERKCAKPQCKKQCLLHCRAFSQQTGRLHAHIGNCKTKKRNSQAHILECLRAISVPANLLPAGAIMKACCCRRPLYMPPHFADGAFGIAVSG